MSYSCGKDSTLALHKMVQQGNMPIGLIVMVNEESERSFFHGATRQMLEEYEKVLRIPIYPVFSAGDDYHLQMENALLEMIQPSFAGLSPIITNGVLPIWSEFCESFGKFPHNLHSLIFF